MTESQRFTSIRFKNFKAFKNYSVSLKAFNVLVGPNNSGKSTIIGAFRILAEGMRKAYARKPEYIHVQGYEGWGYNVPLQDIPVATENVFSDYDDSVPARVEFHLSNGNTLVLHFPEISKCYLLYETIGKPISSPSHFRREYGATISCVPILGPVEHNEPLYKRDAARLALSTHRASRNFRNIWYHFPGDFEEFRGLILSTWPGMDIQSPEVNYDQEKAVLYMFCPEERYPREIFWAGFGFQVWCQMLTYIVRSRADALFVIDEPDIYLHSDLQRQLLGILKTLGPDILIATHSTEIISEAEPDDLLIVNKKLQSAKRIKDPSQLLSIFNVLGSNLNPTLTQLAKSRRAVFVEGKDFQIVSLFARRIDKPQVANRSDFAVIPVEGFNARKVRDFSRGIELTLGTSIIKGVIFDRDYRSKSEVNTVEKELGRYCSLAYIHKRKEIENYLLSPIAIERAIQRKILERNKRGGESIKFDEDVNRLLLNISSSLKNKIASQYIARRSEYEKSQKPGLDQATITESVLSEFERLWEKPDDRFRIVPGKQIFSLLNAYLQENYQVTISAAAIIGSMSKDDIPTDMIDLIGKIDALRLENPGRIN